MMSTTPLSLRRQVLVFATIGVISTGAYALLYLAVRTASAAEVANAAALILTAIGNTAANRRLTFGVRDRSNIVRDQAAGLIALLFALAITTGAATALHLSGANVGHLGELAVLVVANAVATLARFVILRAAVTGAHTRPARERVR